jgi:HAD superfamily hydrolase (TIGR01509 family)
LLEPSYDQQVSSPSFALRALVFDFDGLILDTETPEFVAWQEVFAAYGARLTTEEWANVIGSTDHGWNAGASILRQTGEAVPEEALRAKFKARQVLLLDAETIRPGVTALIAGGKERGLALGVASSSPRWWVEGHLTRLGLFAEFAAVTTGDEVPRTKPDPAVYRLAVSRLGVPAESALALEDSPNGVQAAHAAGLRCVAVPNSVSRHLDLSAADAVLDSLALLDLDALPFR